MPISLGHPTPTHLFLILAPLLEEHDALLAALRAGEWSLTEDPTPAWIAVDPRGTTRVVLCALHGMGRVHAAAVAGPLIDRWRPHGVFLTGIAGGFVSAGVAIGDILIADQLFDYELQKLRPDAEEYRPQVFRTDLQLLASARKLLTHGPSSGTLHIGSVATGDKVGADPAFSSQLVARWSTLLGLEMEAGGVARACLQANVPFLMVRAVSDLADADKDSIAVRGRREGACQRAAVTTLHVIAAHVERLTTAMTDEDRIARAARSRRALGHHLPRGLDRLLSAAFDNVPILGVILGEAASILQDAAPAAPRLGLQHVPGHNALLAWNAALSESSKMSPATLLAILLVARSRVDTVPELDRAIAVVEANL